MKQVTFAVSIYHNRPEFLVKALQELFNFLNTDRADGFTPKFVCDVSASLCHFLVRGNTEVLNTWRAFNNLRQFSIFLNVA